MAENGVGRNLEVSGTAQEREKCGAIMGEVMDLWDKGNHNLDSKAYRPWKDEYAKRGCDNLEGFPPFGKIPKA